MVVYSSFACPKLLTAQAGKSGADSIGIADAGPRSGPVAAVEEREWLEEAVYPLTGIDPRHRLQSFEGVALDGYHDYDALTDKLNAYAEAYPDICRLHTLGQSVHGRELWALLVTDNPDDEEDEPEFRYGSTIHGNEPEGTELCLRFIELLLTEYGETERITHLVDNTAVWIMPLMNPDSRDRYNANGVDLNRGFPLITDGSKNMFQGGPLDAATREPEVKHVMKWMAQNGFVLSADLHSGEEVVIYPYCHDYMAAPDEALLQDIAKRYSVRNVPMWNNRSFFEGVSSGAGWFVALGTAQDWCYIYLGCHAVTIELHKGEEILPASEIPALWADNAEAMLSLVEAVHGGVRGIVRDQGSDDPLWAEVFVEGNRQPVFTDPDVGDYYRLLLPGTYNLVFYARGYVPRVVRDVVVTDESAVRVDVALLPQKASPDFNQDGIVDIQDLTILMAYSGQNKPLVDIAPLPDGDGVVDEQDLDLFLEHWQEEIPGPPDPHLVAHWALDETEGGVAHDSAGSTDGVVLGDPVRRPDEGMVDGALGFDGFDDYILVSDTVLDPADGPFSVLAWIQGGAPGQVIVSQIEGTNWLGVDAITGCLITELRGIGRFRRTLRSNAVVTDGNWHRIALVSEGDDRSLYVDGVLVAQDAQAGGPASCSGGLNIGCGADATPGTFFSGLLDDVRVYNRAAKP